LPTAKTDDAKPIQAKADSHFIISIILFYLLLFESPAPITSGLIKSVINSLMNALFFVQQQPAEHRYLAL